MSTELDGSTVCIVGHGNIGRALARMCRGFGMRVLALRRSRPQDDDGDPDVKVGGLENLREFLAAADFVVLAMPLTRETKGFMDEEKLSWLKPSCCLINIARGDLVREDPLCAALTSGRLAGFASDVWWDYAESLPAGYHWPMPSRRGVHLLPNVLASGDAAANVLAVKERMISLGLESLRAFLLGEPIPRLVDPELGY